MAPRARGFTLLELMLAFALLGLLMALVAGSLGLATKSWDAGEARIDRVGQMRITETLLRSQFSQLHPWRWKKAQGSPLAFVGENERVRFVAPLVARAGQGGVSWFQLGLEAGTEHPRLVLRRLVPDSSLLAFPDFGEAEKTVLAENIAELKFRYFGREGKLATGQEPTWRDTWEDPDRLPMLIELKVKPANGEPWPELLTAPMVGGEAGCRWDSFHQRCR
ncbi:MAG: prepilin-type N-terminal cleavage/methylation domain-containing protein [Betaproteobacteria bacterium]|nr:prepilin-type N-terminal cleavage/methylation domain-containing protein [Betaproteobacteria bacterium]